MSWLWTRRILLLYLTVWAALVVLTAIFGGM